MSYFFTIIGTQDNPLFSHEFGTSRGGGDGVARFREEQRHMNQFIAHAALDIVDEVQWSSGAMYMKYIDRFFNNYVACFLTGAGARFLLVHNPDPSGATATNNTSGGGGGAHARGPASASAATASTIPPAAAAATTTTTAATTNSIAANPTSPAAEEAVRQFFHDVFENWVKAVMNPFYSANQPIKSEVFRARVAAAGRRYL